MVYLDVSLSLPILDLDRQVYKVDDDAREEEVTGGEIKEIPSFRMKEMKRTRRRKTHHPPLKEEPSHEQQVHCPVNKS